MKVCLPVSHANGLESPVHDHFGSAPAFAIVDSDTGSVEFVVNENSRHEHGACRPLDALECVRPDVVIVKGIGPGALRGLRKAGIRVFTSKEAQTVEEAIEHFRMNTLDEVDSQHLCRNHADHA